ncbi:MAG TPA: hypothetical protein VN541_12810 [Tepidisphaeraceae bacterium]|nr:hypothetical protein [Tepidisphaeraceae bacterium]
MQDLDNEIEGVAVRVQVLGVLNEGVHAAMHCDVILDHDFCPRLSGGEDNDPPPAGSFGGEITRPGATVILWHAFTLGTGLRQLC